MNDLFSTLFDAKIDIAGYPLLWREIIGNLFGFASAIGGLRRRVWAWPVGIIGNVILFTVFFGVAVMTTEGRHPLYGQAFRQVDLVSNYRSTPAVLEVVDAWLAAGGTAAPPCQTSGNIGSCSGAPCASAGRSGGEPLPWRSK